MAAVYVRRAGRPGAAADMRASEAEALLAELRVPFLITADSQKMLSHAHQQGLVP